MEERDSMNRRAVLERVALAMVTLVSALVMLGIVGENAHAQASNGVAVEPNSDPGQVKRSSFDYVVPPGGQQDDALRVSNLTDKQQQYFVYAANGFNTDGGLIGVRTDDFPKTGPVTWLRFTSELPDGLVTLEPKTAAVIPFRISVPADATPGDYAFGIAAIPPTQRPKAVAGQQVTTRIVQASAVAVTLRVDGPLQPSLHVTDLQIDADDALVPVLFKGQTNVKASVTNDGNVRLRANVQIIAKDIFGHTVHTSEQTLPSLLPGNTIVVRAQWHDVAFLKGSIVVNVTSLDTSNVGATREKGYWAVPWRFILMIAIVIATWWYWRRRRRRNRELAEVDPPVQPPIPQRELVRAR